MPDLPFDVTVANRFISSLSKSLQALCHGCMDFDSGVEIVGYINVNIDCGSKVDYVLNEKVSKSTNNSMTFVSNSFLAKKDQPKQTRDGACSPVLHFGSQSHTASPYHRVRGFSHGSWSRSGYHGAHFHRGAQKRGYGAELRSGSKRPRHMHSGSSSSAQFSMPVSSQGLPDETFNSGNLRHQQYQEHSASVNQNQIGDGESSAINIKKETLEESDETSPHSENSGQQLNSCASDLEAVNIKSDPDGKPVIDNETVTNTKTESSENNDFKGTFLQPTSQDNQESSDKVQSSESGDQIPITDQPVSFETPFPNPESPSAAGEDDASNNAHETYESNTNIGEDDSEATSSKNAAVEYDTAAEETSYSEYPDCGEGTSSGQFEVIEIDDEDEDMQAMFGASHTNEQHLSMEAGFGHPSEQLSENFKFVRCLLCGENIQSSLLNFHMTREHSVSNCQLGPFKTRNNSHKVQANSAKCPICDGNFSRMFTLKRHMKHIHGVSQCPKCFEILKAGPDFNRHLIYCNK